MKKKGKERIGRPDWGLSGKAEKYGCATELRCHPLTSNTPSDGAIWLLRKDVVSILITKACVYILIPKEDGSLVTSKRVYLVRHDGREFISTNPNERSRDNIDVPIF